MKALAASLQPYSLSLYGAGILLVTGLLPVLRKITTRYEDCGEWQVGFFSKLYISITICVLCASVAADNPGLLLFVSSAQSWTVAAAVLTVITGAVQIVAWVCHGARSQ